jgi:L-aspartate oxidase
LHGANRLASNSLLEACVLAHRCIETIAGKASNKADEWLRDLSLPEWVTGDAVPVDELVVIYHNWDEIRRLMWDYVGIVRTTKRLQRAATRLRNLEREIQEFYWGYKISTDLLELRNLCTVAALIVDSALLRKESRGLHYTLDYPAPDESQRKDTVLRRA